ncbi:HEAT repeat domain-containing protein [Laspinema olomoucense]|uniref:HEAT repeat domain-containing protein n=1 Tax=Laspinema olomoucense TaxID=3231600 RepID=UPI0021BBB060|nr:HEAT repeat domain-containing protein [Laspinema sp. D3d]MCT7972248.1 HEAT repeat domain-containing protein [Laspinema sp. D3d]
MVKTNILNYLSYLNDSDYIAEIVSSLGADETLIQLLHSEELETIAATCLFITDAVLLGSQNQICQEAWESHSKGAIVPELERLVLSDNHFIRQQVIYTLGKICSYDSIPILLRAFHQFRDQDPILLPRLVGELFWLGVDHPGDVIQSMIASPQYLTRWAVLKILPEFIHNSPDETDERFLMRYKFCESLCDDSNFLIQAEAKYEYQFLKLNLRRRQENLSKSEYKKQKKELQRLKPGLSFFQVSGQFNNYLYENRLYNYSIEELETFVGQLMEETTFFRG